MSPSPYTHTRDICGFRLILLSGTKLDALAGQNASKIAIDVIR
jgi:hypothetical protein